jgi:enoyl-CoA hydratase
MSEFETIRCEVRDGIGIVTVQRPQVLNALNRQAVAELGQAFLGLRDDPGVRGVILTGSGEKAFVAGADIGEIHALDTQSGREFALAGQRVFSLIEGLGKPVVAAVNGFALGGGCELALACTLRLASPNAKLGQPEVKLGVIPGFGGTQRLPRLIGPAAALDLLLTGRTVSADEALALGLVQRVVPQDQLLSEAEKLLREILANAPLAVRLCLEAVHRGAALPLADALALEADLFSISTGSADAREGTAAFLAKRKPDFKGC